MESFGGGGLVEQSRPKLRVNRRRAEQKGKSVQRRTEQSRYSERGHKQESSRENGPEAERALPFTLYDKSCALSTFGRGVDRVALTPHE